MKSLFATLTTLCALLCCGGENLLSTPLADWQRDFRPAESKQIYDLKILEDRTRIRRFANSTFGRIYHDLKLEPGATYRLTYDREWAGGLRMTLRLTHEQNEPTGALFYQPLSAGAAPSADASLHLRHITTADASFALTYQPGAKWVNTKQRRIAANHDAPVYSVSHTAGFKGIFGSDYDYNLTELSIYKRFWPGSWGKIEVYAKGGVQWNRVPYPLLCMPAANLSYIKEDNMFGLIDNMEFLNDRYAALMLSWDLNGKIFNRIPFLRRLKWREYLACVEVVAGIHNIFKLLHVEYVRRLTYLDRPDVEKWGIRFMIRMTF